MQIVIAPNSNSHSACLVVRHAVLYWPCSQRLTAVSLAVGKIRPDHMCVVLCRAMLCCAALSRQLFHAVLCCAVLTLQQCHLLLTKPAPGEPHHVPCGCTALQKLHIQTHGRIQGYSTACTHRGDRQCITLLSTHCMGHNMWLHRHKAKMCLVV
jgi:hypothetical protein